MQTPDTAIENIARASYGKLVAFLASRSRDLAAAEDALGDAVRSALETWSRDGIPSRPEAWLLTVARRRLIDGARRDSVRLNSLPGLGAALAHQSDDEADGFPDERLKLLFVCAHPAIAARDRTPLMLQSVLGLDARRIASAFVVSPAAMGRRLSRAKTKIRKAGIPYRVPAPEEFPERLVAVLDAIYAAYGTGWSEGAATAGETRGLAVEAIRLARVATDVLPDEGEAWGLLALLSFCESRRAARRSADGAYVPLTEQVTALWDSAAIAAAEVALGRAASLRSPGRYQLEAAIQSVHAERAKTGGTEWRTITALYDRLAELAPAVGVFVARAAALSEAEGASAGWAALERLDPRVVASYQPYWAVRAHTARGLGLVSAAREAYQRAIGLSSDPHVRRFLGERAATLPLDDSERS